MNKLSEYEDEQALDLLADLLDPTSMVLGNPVIQKCIRKGNKLSAIKWAIKLEKKRVIQIMALLEGVPVSEFHCNLLTLPKMVLDVINDEGLSDFFSSQGEKILETSSSSATVSSEEEESKDSSSTSEPDTSENSESGNTEDT